MFYDESLGLHRHALGEITDKITRPGEGQFRMFLLPVVAGPTVPRLGGMVEQELVAIVVENRNFPLLKRGSFSMTVNISAVSGTACSRALLFLPFMRSAGIVHLPRRRSNSGHEASATSLRRKAVSSSSS
jgi:hypothetical protein